MNDTIYFSTFNVLVEIEFDDSNNQLFYYSHKLLETNEREAIDFYILNHIAPKTDYFKGPSVFSYKGVDSGLELNLNRYLFHGIIRDVLKSKLDIDLKVKDLIGHSLTNYYFEKVGEQIIKIKNLFDQKNGEKFYYETLNLESLLNAYNQNAETDINLETIVPDVLLKYFKEQKKNYS